MIDLLIRAAIWGGGAVLAWWVADQICMEITNQHLHTHLANAFTSFFDGIRDWCQEHAKRLPKGSKILLKIAEVADEASVQMKRAKKKWELSAWVEHPDGTQEQLPVEEETLTDEQAREMGFTPSKMEPQEYMEIGSKMEPQEYMEIG